MGTVDRALWNRVIEQVVAAGGNIIRPWFTQLEPIALEHGLLEIQVPGASERDYCRKYATRLFTEAAQAATGRLVGICFLTGADADIAETVDEPASAAGLAGPPVLFAQGYTFDTFVAGPCNRLAHAACLAVSEAPGRTYNPLFLHGSVGLGKSHLLHATCRKITDSAAGVRISILSCETFVNQFIEAVERGELHEFRYRYRHADVLAVDDIQFLANHEQIQEEFFHTFNTIYQSRRQIILSCDRGPGQIPSLEERLISRFQWGLVAQVGRPCYETRVAIVRKKARLRGIAMPEDVVCFLAGAIDSNTRELEGAISKVAMLAQVAERPIDMALAEGAVGTEPDATQREITIEDILNAVTSRFNVRLADLQSRKRNRSIAYPRQICMFLARALTRHSLEEIGGYFGGRDHSTVLHANKTIKALRAQDLQLQATLDRLIQDIRANQSRPAVGHSARG